MKPSIPPELYRNVVEKVDQKSDLYNLLFVSHQLRLEAELCLYTNIKIDLGNKQELKEVCKMLLDVMRNPRLAAYIRSLDCGRLDHHPFTEKNLAGWVELMQVGVSGLPNLKHLALPMTGYSPTNPSLAALFRLHTLACDLFIEGCNTSNICEFLHSQPDIRDLSLSFRLDGLNSDALPNLERLTCANFGVLQDLLPGRAIRRLRLEMSCNSDPAVPERVLGATGLTELDIDVFKCFSPFGECFGTLERLSVCVFTLNEFESLKTVLPNMRRLNYLQIKSVHTLSGIRGSVLPSAFRALNELISVSEYAIRAVCPSLESLGLIFVYGEEESEADGEYDAAYVPQ